MTEVDLLKQRLDILEQEYVKLNLQLSVMHRALLRCQARTWCLADAPRGWRAVWRGIRDMLWFRRRRRKEREELLHAAPRQMAYVEQTEETQKD